jgi:4,5-dihydroxyphthalate decarboxylase
MLNEHFGVPYDRLRIVDPLGILGEVPSSSVAGVGPDGWQARSEQMLLDGEVDALISAGVPSSFINGDPRIVRKIEQHVADYSSKRLCRTFEEQNSSFRYTISEWPVRSKPK